MEAAQILTILGGIGALVMFIVILSIVPIGLWITAKTAGAGISMMQLVAMRLRKVPPVTIVNARIKQVWAGVQDPHTKVAGKGFVYLDKHGVIVRWFDRDLQEIIRKENAEFFKQAELKAVEEERHEEGMRVAEDVQHLLARNRQQTLPGQLVHGHIGKREVFPLLGGSSRRQGTVAFTATRWGTLLDPAGCFGINRGAVDNPLHHGVQVCQDLHVNAHRFGFGGAHTRRASLSPPRRLVGKTLRSTAFLQPDPRDHTARRPLSRRGEYCRPHLSCRSYRSFTRNLETDRLS
jgi:hypothetical protein